jgi:hypothetical protein
MNESIAHRFVAPFKSSTSRGATSSLLTKRREERMTEETLEKPKTWSNWETWDDVREFREMMNHAMKKRYPEVPDFVIEHEIDRQIHSYLEGFKTFPKGNEGTVMGEIGNEPWKVENTLAEINMKTGDVCGHCSGDQFKQYEQYRKEWREKAP